MDSNQRANSRRPRLSKPAPWTTRPMLLILGAHSILDSVHRECDLPHARRRLDLLPMWAEKFLQFGCVHARWLALLRSGSIAAQQVRPGAHGALARPWARSKAVLRRHTRIEFEIEFEMDGTAADLAVHLFSARVPRRPVPAGTLRQIVKERARRFGCAAVR